MVRLFAWALFLGLATATPSMEHLTYRYEVQLATGSPESSQLWSGLKLTANLSIQTDGQRVVAMLKHVNLQKMDKFLTQRTPNFFMQPQESLLDGVEVDIKDTMIRPLQEPFSFVWNKGHVQQVRFDRLEPLFSKNIKKGILNLLYVSVDKLFSVDAIKDKSSILYGQKESYTVLEPSPYGECLTTYTPELIPEEPAAEDSLYLTKVRNYSSVYTKAPLAYSFDNLKTANNKSTDHLNLQAMVRYGIVGTKDQFLITSAIGQSKVVVIPYARKDGTIQTSVNQTLYLLKRDSLKEALPSIQVKQERMVEDLKMDLPIDSMEDRWPYTLNHHHHRPRVDIPWAFKKMDQILTLIANETNDYPTTQMFPVTQTLMDMIRQSSYKELTMFAENVLIKKRGLDIENPILLLKKKILWNLLSNAGTTTASKVVLHFCIEKLVSYDQCLSAVTSIGLYTPPSERIIILLLELVDKTTITVNQWAQAGRFRAKWLPSIHAKRQLQDVSTLALGSVLGRAQDIIHDSKKFINVKLNLIQMIKDQFTEEEMAKTLDDMAKNWTSKLNMMTQKHEQIVHRVIKEVFEKLMNKGDEILLLKALRNAHVPNSVNMVEEMLHKSRDLMVRLTAAQTFETFIYSKDKVLLILETVLKNPDNQMSVRIQAFRSMVHLKAPVHMLVRIADIIAYDQEKQLTTYVWSVFSHLANSTFRPYRPLASKFRKAMALIKPVEYGMQDSHYSSMHLDMADEVSFLGETNLVSGPDSSMNWDISSTLDMFGTSNKAFKFTFISEGIMKIIKKMVGPKGFLSKGNSLWDLLQRNKRDAHMSVPDMINKIFKDLDIKHRDFHKHAAFADLQVMNQVVRLYRYTDLETLDKENPFLIFNFNEDFYKSGMMFSLQASGILNQFYMELPTEAGFPVNLQMGLTYSGQVNGTLKMGVEESLYKKTRGNRLPMKYDLALELKPKVVGAMTGKMSVDGYLFQTGSLFEATANIQPAFNTTMLLDPLNARISAKLAPTCSNTIPMVKLEIKPYVFSMAVARDVKVVSPVSQNKDVEVTNDRPLFLTMQPVAISQDAILKQGEIELGQKEKGYCMTVQYQAPVKGLESVTTTSPMLGRSHIAVYVDSGMEYPPELVADLKFFTRPRYEKEACDAWNWPWCHSMDEDSPVPVRPEIFNASHYMGKIHGIPDLGTPITLPQLKKNVFDIVGEEMPMKISRTEWGFIGVFNGTSSTTVKGVGQSWNRGQYHESIITVLSIPVYFPKEKPWKMSIKSSAIYPDTVITVHNLLETSYQQKIHDKITALLKRKEHKVINKYLKNLLFNIVNEGAMRNLPSMQPQIMLDRILPEFILLSENPEVAQVRYILKDLLPLSQQIIDLDSQLMDTPRIKDKETLLRELQIQVIKNQLELITLIEKLKSERDQEDLPRPVITSVEYAVLKMTECVLHLRQIIQRGINLHLLQDKSFEDRMYKIDKNLDNIYILSVANLVPHVEDPEPYAPERNSREFDFVAGYNSEEEEDIEDKNNAQWINVIPSLKQMLKHQMKEIEIVWKMIMHDRKPQHSSLEPLIEQTAEVVTLINTAIVESSLTKNRTISSLLTQATIQHQMLHHIISVCRLNGNESDSITNFDRYSLKVQTKQLLERSSILTHQDKMTLVCSPRLNETEIEVLKTLQKIDRIMVALQHAHIRLPTSKYPWTTDSDDLNQALLKMEPALVIMKELRDKLLANIRTFPHPCVMAKMVETATTFQDRVDIFKRTLLAQIEDHLTGDKMTQRFHSLDDNTMDFVLSLSPLFEMYVLQNDTSKNIFPKDEILISESLLDLSHILHEQREVLKYLDLYLDRPDDSRNVDNYKMDLRAAYLKSAMILKKLKDASVRLHSAVMSSSQMTFYATYQQFLIAYDQQIQIYHPIMAYLNKFPNLAPEMNNQVPQDLEYTRSLKNRLQELTDPENQDEMPEAMEDSSSSLEDISIEDLDSEEESFEAFDSQEDEVAEVQAHPPVHKLLKHFPRNLAPLFDGIIFNTNITWDTGKYLAFKAYAKKSVEQLMWEATQFYPRTRDYGVARTVEDAIEGLEMMDKSCEGTCLRLNTYNHVHMQLASASDELPPMLKKLTEKFMLWNYARHYDRSIVTKPQSFIQPGTMEAVLDFSHTLDSVNEYFMNKKETLTVRSMPLPPFFQAINPFQNIMTVSKLFKKKTSKGLYPAECQMQKGNMKTTDGALYKLPPLVGQTLLAADCSSDQAFAILTEPISGPEMDISSSEDAIEEDRYYPHKIDILNKKSITILAQEHVVTLKPSSMSVTVTLDGIDIDLTYNNPVIKYIDIEYDWHHVSVAIGLREDGIVVVDYPLVGLRIHMGVNRCTVEMARVYSQQLCGLCGNFDGQITWELVGPRKEVFPDAANFVSSYTLNQQPPRYH